MTYARPEFYKARINTEREKNTNQQSFHINHGYYQIMRKEAIFNFYFSNCFTLNFYKSENIIKRIVEFL